MVTSRSDGDQRSETASRFGAARPAPRFVQVARQVHGAQVAVIERSFEPNGVVADALVTTSRSLALSVLGADCSLIGLVGSNGVIGVVHAGWRGLLAGVVENAVETMRGLGASVITAFIGPTIGPECYAFSPEDLEPLVERFGRGVRASTRSGEDALDLPRGVGIALERSGVTQRVTVGTCTGCDDRFFSFRMRKDEERHALYLWQEDPK